MDVPATWVAAAVAAFLGLAAGWILTSRHLLRKVRALTSQRQSQAARYGQALEQFAPFLATWPWDPQQFRFLGDPIDGIQFTPEGIILVEIKSARSRLRPNQAHVRRLVRPQPRA
ncbi:MAG TPA: Holliday junction resolvase-like protein, partial [Candidatus Thermoplasmatota archaeon]|nr:Holliday junction resolvase-like protein [Candidatus Thermoplasmatota archaeon]